MLSSILLKKHAYMARCFFIYTKKWVFVAWIRKYHHIFNRISLQYSVFGLFWTLKVLILRRKPYPRNKSVQKKSCHNYGRPSPNSTKKYSKKIQQLWFEYFPCPDRSKNALNGLLMKNNLLYAAEVRPTPLSL